MKTMKKIVTTLLLVCVLASVLSVSAYATDTTATDEVTGITLNVSGSATATASNGSSANISLSDGDTITITPMTTVTGSPSRAVTYEVSNTSVLVQQGNVDGESGAATFKVVASTSATSAWITVKTSNASISATVNVAVAAKEVVTTPTPTISIRSSSDTVAVGKTLSLTAECSSAFGYWKIDQYVSGYTGFGTIDNVNNTKVTFTATKAGKVRLVAYASDGKTSAIYDITVTEPRTLTLASNKDSLVYTSDDWSQSMTGVWVTNAKSDDVITWTYTTVPSSLNTIVTKFETYGSGTGSGVNIQCGSGSGSITVTATAADGSTGSKVIYVNSKASGDASIAPTSATWSKGQSGLTFTVQPNFYAAYIDGVCISGSGNTDKYSHVWSSKNIVISSSYLATLSAGDHILRVDTVYDDGTKAGSAYATITINGTASAVYGDNAHVRGTSSDLTFTSTNPISSVVISNTTIDPANYTLSNNGKTITLKANFLNLLNYGTYTMQLGTTTGGTETTTFRIVTANYAPATGDDSNLAIWVAVMIVSGIGAVALIPRKKKQN